MLTDLCSCCSAAQVPVSCKAMCSAVSLQEHTGSHKTCPCRACGGISSCALSDCHGAKGTKGLHFGTFMAYWMTVHVSYLWSVCSSCHSVSICASEGSPASHFGPMQGVFCTTVTPRPLSVLARLSSGCPSSMAVMVHWWLAAHVASLTKSWMRACTWQRGCAQDTTRSECAHDTSCRSATEYTNLRMHARCLMFTHLYTTFCTQDTLHGGGGAVHLSK